MDIMKIGYLAYVHNVILIVLHVKQDLIQINVRHAIIKN